MIVGDLLFIEYVERLSMSDCESMPAEVRDRLRSIPAVHELLVEWPVMKAAGDAGRSEERRVGKECASMCRSRWSPYH